MNNAARKCARWVLPALPLALALAYSSAFAAAFSAPKNALFVFTTAVLAAMALDFFSVWKAERGERALWGAAAGFVAVTLVSALLSRERRLCAESVEFQVCGVLLLVAARTVLGGRRITQRLQIAVSAAAALVALVTAAQFFGMSVEGGLGHYAGSADRMRMYGTLGNPDFVAAFLAVAMPAALGQAIAARRLVIRPFNSVQASHPFRDKTCEMDGALRFDLRAGSIKALWIKALWILVSVAIGCAVVLTGSRGGALAMMAGVSMVVLLAMRGRALGRIAVLAAVVAVVALAAGTQLNARTPWESLRGRILIWQVALGDGAARSALGSGPGTFAYEYPVRLGRFFAEPGREALLHFASHERHAQNDFVEAWHETGWLGLGSLLAVLGAWFAVAARRLRESDEEARQAVSVAIASVIALCVASLFDFPMHRAETWALLWIWMAVPLASQTLRPAPGRRAAWPRYAGAVLVVVAGSYLAFGPLAGSYELAKGEREESSGRLEASRAADCAALRWEPWSADANFDLVRVLAKTGDYSGALRQSGVAVNYVNEPELSILRSRILENAGRSSEARGEIERAVRIFPYSMELREELASNMAHGTSQVER